MGIFPYTCQKCGGGYKRCGNQASCEPGCSGGQMCYEKTVAIELANGEIVFGSYSGYGYITSDTKKNTIFVPTEFEDFLQDWRFSKRKKIQLVPTVYCRSCYQAMNA